MKLNEIRQLPKAALYILLGLLLTNFGNFLVVPFLAVYFVHKVQIALPIIGYAFSAQILCQRGGSILGGILADKFGERYVLSAASLLSGMAFLGFAFVHTGIALIGNCVILGLSNALSAPASKKALVNFVNADNRILILALRNTAMNVGVAIGPLIGAIAMHFNPKLSFYITGSIFLIFTVLFFKHVTHTASVVKLCKFDIKQLLSVFMNCNLRSPLILMSCFFLRYF